MKITDRKNEAALDLIVEILEPASKIFSDKELRKILAQREAPIKVAKYVLKNYKKEVIEMLAALKGVSCDEYEANAFQMLAEMLEVVQDEELLSFFTSFVKTAP
nr:MAG TPA: hypothetical protein [Caudoviricetes sp.]